QTSSAETAATAWRTLGEDRPSGLATLVQRAPSQCSTSVERPEEPTAQTSSGEASASATSSLACARRGLRTRLHAAPSQCSASVRNSELSVSRKEPTAQTSFDAAAPTPLR